MALSQKIEVLTAASVAMAEAGARLREIIRVNDAPVLFGFEEGGQQKPPIIQDGDQRLSPGAATDAASALMGHWASVRADLIAAAVNNLAAAKVALDAAWLEAVLEYGDGSGPFE